MPLLKNIASIYSNVVIHQLRIKLLRYQSLCIPQRPARIAAHTETHYTILESAALSSY